MASATELLNAGIGQHQAGQFAQARALYEQALAAEPQNADALSLLGAVSINLLDWPAAVRHLQAALAVNPEHLAALENLGVLLARQEQYGEAIVYFERVLKLNPNSVSTWQNLAGALGRKGQSEAAIAALKRVAQLAPDQLRAHAELAETLSRAGRIAEALPHLHHVARLKPQDPKARFELAAALAACGQPDLAIAAYEEVLRLKPDSAESCVNLAHVYIHKQQPERAVAWAERAVALRPRMAEAHLNLGSALVKHHKHAEAAEALERAIALKPDSSEAHNNLGIAATELGQASRAEEHYRRALALCPGDADAYYNLGTSLLKQNQIRAAIEQFNRALDLRPDFAEAHHNRSAALLLEGRLAEGLAEYEWRLRSRDFPKFALRWPAWDGTSLAGRTIVLCAEQGMGDTFQFVRYAPLVREQGAKVLVECPPALHPILSRTPGIDGLVLPADPPPEADCAVPMLSLPFRLGTTLETIPREVPYLFADPALVTRWKARLAETPGFKVGICWQGNPHCPGDRLRSIALEHFAPLAAVEGVRLVNLQKGPGLDQLDALGQQWRMIDFGEVLDTWSGAFMDTAAIIQSLDLVITSDTAMAHLAGGLGAPVWVALPFSPDWRWLLDRDDCPWYPTMRLFRQRTPRAWPEVFTRMAGELANLIARG